MIKNDGPVHRAPLTGAGREKSVLTGRTLEEIAGGKLRPRGAARAAAKSKKKASTLAPVKKTQHRTALAPAKFIAPMKALSVDGLPERKWRLELKLDGYRAVAVINEGEIELWSRNHKSLTADYPEVVEALRKISCTNAVIDGEIVALDAEGRSRFQLLQNRGAVGKRPPIVYYVFDLLHHDGRSLLHTALEERQMALEVLVGKKAETVKFSPVFEVDPDILLKEVRAKGLEGIIAKQPGSLYEPDRRSGTWLKLKVHGEQEFVIGGFSAPRNSRQYFGAILVGYYRDSELFYAGKVGSGFDAELLRSLHREFTKRRVETSPFVNLPQAKKPRFGLGMTVSAMRDVTWIKPDLVAQVRFAEWTHDSLLRQPVFLGLRRDKSAREVVREAAPVEDEV
jgi:bifunctional non-homologous end joining protein LigD